MASPLGEVDSNGLALPAPPWQPYHPDDHKHAQYSGPDHQMRSDLPSKTITSHPNGKGDGTRLYDPDWRLAGRRHKVQYHGVSVRSILSRSQKYRLAEFHASNAYAANDWACVPIFFDAAHG